MCRYPRKQFPIKKLFFLYVYIYMLFGLNWNSYESEFNYKLPLFHGIFILHLDEHNYHSIISS